MEFWLGTHQPVWLSRYDVPMMVSRRTLMRYRTKPQARARWFRDSGGFTELQMHGEWTVDAAAFAAEAQMDASEVGGMEYCAPRDWMCEPLIINGGWANGLRFVGTKLSVAEHQRRTVADYLDLMQRAPELLWVPVLQGWELDDYLRCEEMYDLAGVNLLCDERKHGADDPRPLVGVGTICRRQGTREAAEILRRLNADGLRLHAFGLKGTGIPNVAPFLASADSLAWSYAARRRPPLPECEAERRRTGKGHKNCANCARYAFQWLAEIERSIQLHRPKPYQTTFVF
jgi:hypothetical protein